MDYAKYVKGVPGFSPLRLAAWAVVLAAVIAGILALSSGLS
jgi:hypothetical protein